MKWSFFVSDTFLSFTGGPNWAFRCLDSWEVPTELLDVFTDRQTGSDHFSRHAFFVIHRGSKLSFYMFRFFKSLAEDFILKLNKTNCFSSQKSCLRKIYHILSFLKFEFWAILTFDLWTSLSWPDQPSTLPQGWIDQAWGLQTINEVIEILDNMMLRTNLSQSFPSDVGGSRDQLCHHGATEQNRVGKGYSGLEMPQAKV